MPDLRIQLGRILAFTVFALGLGYFSNSPSYTYHDPDKALLVVSFSHASERKEECRAFSRQEIEQLAANMRRPLDCPRERVPVLVEIRLDDTVLLSKAYRPTGLARDGSASIYASIPVTAGQHSIVASLRDSKREQGFDYTQGTRVQLAPREIFVIDFRKDTDGFIFTGKHR